jgi:hypothetical protein
MPAVVLYLAVISPALFGNAQQAVTSQPAQTQQQPCVAANGGSKPNLKAPKALTDPKNKIGKLFNQYNIFDTPIPPSAPKTIPCPPASVTPNTQIAPVLHIPSGVVTTWLCNPIVTSSDASHTTTFVTPDSLSNAEPSQVNAFEADGAKADLKAAASCANLRRDPKTNKVFLAQ